MSGNGTPMGERVHIAFLGKRNAGKSSLVNAVTAQQLSVVSEVRGTTTDLVGKAMELLPLGPVVILDTPGFDDEGELGALRVAKTEEAVARTDLAVFVLDGTSGISELERDWLKRLKKKQIPILCAVNKKDDNAFDAVFWNAFFKKEELPHLFVSAKTKEGIEELKQMLGRMLPERPAHNRLAADFVKRHDLVVLVVPIDDAAPKGRLILPQQQVIRDLLEAGAHTLVVKDSELSEVVQHYGEQIKLVITDSQAFEVVAKIVPEHILLTSFSILMARYKGFLSTALSGISKIDRLQEGDRILIAEGCTHHRQCEDIGTVKIPSWLRSYTGRELWIDTCSGREFPTDLTPYALVIHCGGCMLNEQEMKSREERAKEQGIAFTNYGLLIAKMKGILERSIKILEKKS